MRTGNSRLIRTTLHARPLSKTILVMTSTINELRNSMSPKPVPLNETFHLDPLEKLRKYRVIPFTLLINIAILTLLLVFAFTIQNERNQFIASSRYGLAVLFFSPADNTDRSFTVELDTIPEFVEFIRNISVAYFTVPETSSGVYMHYVNSFSDPRPVQPTLSVNYHEGYFGTDLFDSIMIKRFELSEDEPVGPFDNISSLVPVRESCLPVSDKGHSYIPCRNSTIGDFFDRMISASIDLKLRGVRMPPSARAASVVKWSVRFDMRFSSHNSVVEVEALFDNEETHLVAPVAVDLCLALLPLALLDFVLRLRSFQLYRLYVLSFLPQWLVPNLVKDRKRFMREWDRRNVKRSGKGWAIFGMSTDTVTVIFCCVSIADSYSFVGNADIVVWQTLLLGLSTMFSCLLLISFLETSPKLYILMKVLSTALPHLMLYLVGVFPIFFGVAICGTAVFGGFTELFETLPKAMVTLFCALNGDSLLDIFSAIDQTDFAFLQLFARIYFCAFLGIFICNVLNIALSIVQDSYAHVKELYISCRFDEIGADQEAVTQVASVSELSALLKSTRNVLGTHKK